MTSSPHHSLITVLIAWCLRNRTLVICAYVLICLWGIRSIYETPIDAIPDLSENQVIVLAEWPGRSAQEVEDQVTYPLSTSLQGLPGVKTVRASSAFGFGMLTVVFRDDIDVYFARTRILEKLNALPFALPEGVVPKLGPDATSLGWVFQYYLDDTEARKSGKAYDLGQLRDVQDWLVRYQLNSVPGVAEVASIGGFVRQYQVDVDPNKLRGYGLGMMDVLGAVQSSNRNVGGGNVERGGRDFTLRGLALVQDTEDLKKMLIGYHQGQPVFLGQVANVQMGPAVRRGVLDAAGHEVAGGIVIMRYGESTPEVIAAVKKKIAEIQPALPEGLAIRPFYDQSGLIDRAVETLREVLIEEMILVTLAHIIFLAHFRSVVIVTLPLPLSILMAFILMKESGISSNIMSLSGIAIAIGVLVDAAVVMTEACMREAHRVQEGRVPGLRYPQDMPEIVLRAAHLVARPIFFSMLIIILAFIPVFALAGQEGKLFHPLAFTKTFAMLGATLLSVTLIPVLVSLFVRGRLHDENDNAVMRFLLALYRPALDWALAWRGTVLAVAAVLLVFSCWLLTTFGREFMPPLNEGALLFMPQTVPSASLPEVNRVMAAQNKILSAFPEVASVVGKLGRADTATDPAPVGMIETTLMLKPRSQWREGMTPEKLRDEMQQAMFRFPGFPPAFLQPIENRILMLNTGIRGQVAVKIFGEDLDQLQALARQAEAILRQIPGASGVVAERVTGAPYLEIDVRRDDAARYGVAVGDVLDIVETALGGKDLTTTIEGRKRYGIRVRYPRELRDSPERIGQVLVSTEAGDTIPLSKVADVRLVMGPSMISSENGLLRVFVQANVEGRDLSGFVEEARAVVSEKLKLPEGTFISWGGQYENLVRAEKTLVLIIPVVLFIIFILLFMIYGSVREAGHVLLAVPFALTGGVLLQALAGYPFSVAVWVGYIALFGTAVQTGVVMVIYLEEAVRAKRQEKGGAFGLDDLRAAVREGALLRLRPKVMTVSTIVASLGVLFLPFAEGRTGIEVMRPIAIPVIGGMASSLLHILIVTPVIFLFLRERELKNEQRKKTP